ncbi:MAG: FliM/FliN family flagellar motor switch protein [Muribaculaceae bacterium]|nr:FliM/FliN family flagellar motor switch protein [Muribaculaceae bacterium]
MEDKLQNSISTKQLYREFDWYQKSFPSLVQGACDEFFEENFKLELIGLSKNINCLLDNESCFVTKIRIDKEHDIFFRLTDKAINIILSKILGPTKHKFNINKISELESKVITSFNDFMFEHIKSAIAEPDPTQLKRSNFDTIHLTFVIKEVEEYSHMAGKFIVSLPQILLNAESIESAGGAFSEDEFPGSETFAAVFVGKTKFSLYDIKNLETEDVVVFEDSNLRNVKLRINGENLDVNINPNMDLLIPDIDNGGDEMGETHENIWDSIEVEMSAEFDTVKITLGELKDIENGLVVDLASLYDNNVTLKVEGKPIASGSLVIVNDRYGVKINNVYAQGQEGGRADAAASEPDTQDMEEDVSDSLEEQTPVQQGGEADESDEEFDYSDFELEDENI